MQYMAPEQLSGGEPTPLWDLWALALVVYELLAGTHPFAGIHPGGWHAAQMAGRWTPIGERLRGASPDLQAFFSRALDADPARRPPSVAAFFQQFEACVGSTTPPRA